MRAVYIKDLNPGSSVYDLPKDYIHYFINVLRLKAGQDVLLLDGRGNSYYSVISQSSKKQVLLEVKKHEFSEDVAQGFDIGFGLVKKDALESCLRSCCELGAQKIFIIKSEFSQSYELNMDRVQKIVISSCEQSNRAYLPEIKEIELSQLLSERYEKLYWGKMLKTDKPESGKPGKILMLVGPEGGFSETEISMIETNSNSYGLNLGGNILRTRTIIPSIIGYVKAIENLEA